MTHQSPHQKSGNPELAQNCIFDTRALKRNRHRCQKSFESSSYLFDWAAEDLIQRLEMINRNFPLAVQLGTKGKKLSSEKIQTLLSADSVQQNIQIKLDPEALPFAPQSLDLFISNLFLHNINDLPGTLLQIRQSLKPDGLFIASMLGGETLYELRDVLSQAELSLKGGISPRVHPFADKQQMGALLQRAGFALPVVDSEIITISFEHLFSLLSDLRAMGEQNALFERQKSFTPRSLFFKAAELYQERHKDKDGRIKASFEIIFLIGWAPHESQQKPLRPGSAQHSLADAVKGKETLF